MLPFLKKDKDASASMPVDSQMRKPDDGEPYDMMHSAAQDLIDAVHAKDHKAAAAAWRAGHTLLNSEFDDESEPS